MHGHSSILYKQIFCSLLLSSPLTCKRIVFLMVVACTQGTWKVAGHWIPVYKIRTSPSIDSQPNSIQDYSVGGRARGGSTSIPLTDSCHARQEAAEKVEWAGRGQTWVGREEERGQGNCRKRWIWQRWCTAYPQF